MSFKVTESQMEDSRQQPATATYKFPFRRGVHDLRLLSCFIPSRRRLRDKIFLLPSDSSAPGSPSSDGASSIDVDEEEFFSDEDNSATAQLLATDSSSKSPLAHEQTTSSPTQPRSTTSEATEESFVFSAPVLLADTVVVETPSFRTLSDPLLNAFSYDCSADAVTIRGPINLGGLLAQPLRPAPITPSAAAPHQTRAVCLPLPALPLDVSILSNSGGSAMSSYSISTWSSSSATGSENRGDNSIGSTSSVRHHGHAQLIAPVSAMGGLPLPPPSVATQLLPGLRSFEFEELRNATCTFAPECCLEAGAFGAVYRACVKPASCLSNQELGPVKAVELAVVRLSTANCNQTLKEWKSDVQMLAQLPADRNIGVIQGYCAHEDTATTPTSENKESRRRVERLLVFEQSRHGTLHDYLCSRSHSNTTSQQSQLDWPLRVGIALGAARGLLYIHDRAPVQILYRNFTAASVLLDQNYTPRLAGYGLTVTSWPTTADNQSSFSTAMKMSQAHAKTNVWSFGIVLLEILTGRASRDALSVLYCDEKSFVRWATPFLKEEAKLLLILDPCLKATHCPIKGALKLAALAVKCLKKKAAQRPSMAGVVDTLKTLVPDSVGSSTRVHQQISTSKAVETRRVTTFGGISFCDAEHRSKFVGQYLSVQGASSAGCASPSLHSLNSICT